MSEYRWAYPSDWLTEKIDDAYASNNATELKSLLNTCISKMAEDDIQDLFQDEMDADGYFKPVRRKGGRNALAVLLLALALPFVAHAAEKAPRHVTRPISTITVKVMPADAFMRKAGKVSKPYLITTSDADSCTAWVSTKAAPNLPTAQLDAFIACQVAMGRAVKDGAR